MKKKNALLTLAAAALAGSFSLAAVADDAELTVRQSEQYGAYLADGDGNALYLFTKDTQGEGDTAAKSACYDKCADAWPPLLAEDVKLGNGLQQDHLSTVERTDGEKQVTYGGWPLYHFEKDEDQSVKGQGVGDVWYLVSPDGSKNDSKP